MNNVKGALTNAKISSKEKICAINIESTYFGKKYEIAGLIDTTKIMTKIKPTNTDHNWFNY